jgi:acyl CoA:acetate/3-ketoacid CoA transferase beta subunit
VTTSADVLEQLKNLQVKDFDNKIIIDPKINPITTTPEQASAIVKEQVDTLLKKGVPPANIGVIGLDAAFSDINKAVEDITATLGAGFGGAFEKFMSLDSYLSDLDDIIENKITSALALASAIKLPDNIPVDEALVKKYARKVPNLDALGNEQVNFPDTFMPEERPIDGKTPLSDWKDKTKVSVETAGGATITEKASEFAAEYGKNVLVKSNTGHFIEMDDTEGSERINIQHKNGSFITIHQDKSIVIRGQNGIQLITYANNELFVGGNINITVIGDANISTNGNTNIDTVGDVNWKVGGKFNLDAKGDINLNSSESVNQSAGKTTNVKSGNQTIINGSSVEIDSKLNVKGSTNLKATGKDSRGDNHNLGVDGSGASSVSAAEKLGEPKKKEYKLGS